MSTPARAPRLLGPWRRSFQWLLSLAVLVVPFVRIGGESLLRLDVPTLTLHAAGRALPIDALSQVLLLGLSLVLLFLLVTLVLGRAWCGWACPQTTLSDLLEWCEARLARALPQAHSLFRSGAFHLLCLALALLVAANLVWYFVAPYDFFARLMEGRLGWAVGAVLAVVASCVYIDLAFVRRLLCRELCPYGRLQSALVDAATLSLRFDPTSAERCKRCAACVRACPMGIDIRQGEQIECINCARCLDACRKVMAPRHQPGLIRYTLGLENRGLAALLNPRLLLVGAAWLAVSAAFIGTLVLRTPVTLELSRPAAVAARPLDDQVSANFFWALAQNRGASPLDLSLRARIPGGSDLVILGPVENFHLDPAGRRRLDFAVVAPQEQLPSAVELRLEDTQGRTLVRRRAQLLAAPLHKETSAP
ncbi:4Fe-4S binding protein [Geoalkalibacter halelectricus]|uniref:4Fe-4S binding protein n=1 Tax=Geoalkalibacter halelectricus TaxID=2847045 RepID=A0ABY5ZS28_9BACT|nr:4Fe-4S dicluster domain-containing protein [Geoalkalibacter halelectricus]UWZ80737.1 4Fe-4S binding protein [Geoalkalibacter halelectricus]